MTRITPGNYRYAIQEYYRYAIQEIEGEIAYHRKCITNLEKSRERLKRVLEKIEGSTDETAWRNGA